MAQIDDVGLKHLIERKIWESDEMFELRRAFIERHGTSEKFKGKQNRLACLAQILVNIEFLECSYDPQLMQEVAELAQGLIESRHQNRQMIVEKVFSAQKDAEMKPANDEPGTSQKVENYDIRGQKRSLETVAMETDSNQSTKKPPAVPILAPNSNKNAEILNFGGGFWQKPPSVVQTKLTSMQKIRAQFCIAPLKKDPIVLMNQACQQCKFQWRIDFSQPNFCELTIEGVVVVRQRHWGDEERARLEACKTCAIILRRNSLDVQEPVKNMFHLLTSIDLRLSPLESPDASKFEPIETALRAVAQHIKKKDPSPTGTQWRKDPRGFLESACKFNQVPFSIERKRASGWKEDIVVSLCGVELCAERAKMASRNKEQEIEKMHENVACEKAIDHLLKSVVDQVPVNFAENVEDGRLVLNAPNPVPTPSTQPTQNASSNTNGPGHVTEPKAAPIAPNKPGHVTESKPASVPVAPNKPAHVTETKTAPIAAPSNPGHVTQPKTAPVAPKKIDLEAISARFITKLGILKPTLAAKTKYSKNFIQCLHEACMKAKITIESFYPSTKQGPPFECYLRMDEILVATGSGQNKKVARAQAYEIFGQMLHKKHIFVKPKSDSNSDSLVLIASDVEQPGNCDAQNGNNLHN